jgi:hypothetical protein
MKDLSSNLSDLNFNLLKKIKDYCASFKEAYSVFCDCEDNGLEVTLELEPAELRKLTIWLKAIVAFEISDRDYIDLLEKVMEMTFYCRINSSSKNLRFNADQRESLKALTNAIEILFPDFTKRKKTLKEELREVAELEYDLRYNK